MRGGDIRWCGKTSLGIIFRLRSQERLLIKANSKDKGLKAKIVVFE